MTQERAAWTREGILQAAAETFETRGYLGTSLRDIVTRRDVSKGALYFHFQSKEALAIAVVQEHYEKWTRGDRDTRPASSGHTADARAIVADSAVDQG